MHQVEGLARTPRDGLGVGGEEGVDGRDAEAERVGGVGVLEQRRRQVVPGEIDEGGRLLLHPDCGFATFADNPICCNSLAEDKLAVIVQAAARLR